jgi:NAD(P)-dependent dehydrogenase (short-subunit alcohol dehydrogenase family)
MFGGGCAGKESMAPWVGKLALSRPVVPRGNQVHGTRREAADGPIAVHTSVSRPTGNSTQCTTAHIGAFRNSDTSSWGKNVDDQFYYQKAEECLERARRATTKAERLDWHVLAGEWIDRQEEVVALADGVMGEWGHLDVLMNNAGVQPGSAMFGPRQNWERVIRMNLWGVINGVQAFAPRMIGQGRPGLVINAGSKQGITTPPGDPAYNISKAGVKVMTEALAHEFRNTEGCQLTAHLLVPGFVFTDVTAKGRIEKPAGAWTPEQTVGFLLERISAGDFYVLCPDNEVTRALDEKQIAWAAGDIVENRPPLSRWHKDYADAFADFVKSGNR